MHNYSLLHGTISEIEEITEVNFDSGPTKTCIFYIETEDGRLPVRAWGEPLIEQVQKLLHNEGFVDILTQLKGGSYKYHNKAGEERLAININLNLKKIIQ